MELSQLEIYIAAAEEKSFTAAAERLYISHSTISRTVAALEEELGVQLIRRSNRVLELTPAGQELLARAGELLTACDDAAEQVRLAAERSREI